MTPTRRRMAALAALFAPDVPWALLDPSGDAAPDGARLVGASRTERLRALAESLATDPAAARARSEAAAVLERPAVAEVLRVLGAGGAPGPGTSRALVRLCRERIGR
jgi:hypothetical protein